MHGRYAQFILHLSLHTMSLNVSLMSLIVSLIGDPIITNVYIEIYIYIYYIDKHGIIAIVQFDWFLYYSRLSFHILLVVKKKG